MANYNVRFDRVPSVTVTSTTDVVLLGEAGEIELRQRFGPWTFATRSGGVFSFYEGNGNGSSLPLTVATFAAAAVGMRVLADDGTTRWRLGTVSESSDQTVVDGVIVPSTARAAPLLGPQFLPSGRMLPSTLRLLSTAEDGTTWFGESSPILHGDALTTVGAIAVNTRAIVEVSNGSWRLVTV